MLFRSLSLLIHQLAAEGALGFDESVAEILPWLDLGPDGASITVTHLLTHTSGLILGGDGVPDDLAQLLQRALELPNMPQIQEAARERLLAYADGDARRLLNTLETLVVAAQNEQRPEVDDPWLVQVLGERMRRYDKGGEQFYDTISALHRSEEHTSELQSH